MPSIDEQLRTRLQSAGTGPEEVDDLLIRLGGRKRRRATVRKLGTVALVVTVLGGTIGGFLLLDRGFRSGPAPAASPVANGSLVLGVPNEDSSNLMVLPPSEQDLFPQDGVRTADRDSMTILTWEPGAQDVDPAVSPDGSTVAFVRKDASDVPASLWLIGIDGTDEHQVTRAPADVKGPAWSPDGSLIAFSAADEPTGRALYTIRPDGSDLRQIVSSSSVGGVAWSPDGSSVVYSTGDAAIPVGSYDLWTVRSVGGTPTRLTHTAGDETDPSWSPDGSTIAFTSDAGIAEIPSAGGEVRIVVPVSPLGEGRVPTLPAWTPDGSYLTFALAAPPPLSVSTIYVLPVNGTDAFPFAVGASFAWQPVPAGETETLADLGLGYPICRVMSMPITVAGAPGDAYVFTQAADTCPKAGEGKRFVAADLNVDGVVDTTPFQLHGCFPPVGCETFAAPDVNGDGSSEVAVSNAGADGYGVWLFALTTSPPAIVPIDVVDPQGIGYVQTGPLEFAWVDVAGHAEGAMCEVSAAGTDLTIFGYDKFQKETEIRATTLHLDGTTAMVTDASRETIPLADAVVPGNDMCGASLHGSAANFPEASGSEGQDIGLSFNVCDAQSLSGVDLLGDGTDGTAWTGTRVGEDGRCPDPTSTDHIVAIDHTGDGKADAFDAYALPYCFECRPFGTTDLKGDGHEQLVLVAQEGSEIQYTMMVADIREGGVWFGLAFVRNDTGGTPLGLNDGDPFTFWAGGDEGRDEYVECIGSPTRIQLTEFSMPIDGPTRSIDVATFEMRGSDMVLVDSHHSEQPATDPVPDANTGPTCGGLDFDPWA
jgi:WD40-like Beta Propeller Repeat